MEKNEVECLRGQIDTCIEVAKQAFKNDDVSEVEVGTPGIKIKFKREKEQNEKRKDS